VGVTPKRRRKASSLAKPTEEATAPIGPGASTVALTLDRQR
jgi:hypothetical protein